MNQTLKQRKTIPNELVALRKNEIIDEYLSLKKQTAEMAAEIFILTLRLLMLKLNNHAYSQRLDLTQIIAFGIDLIFSMALIIIIFPFLITTLILSTIIMVLIFLLITPLIFLIIFFLLFIYIFNLFPYLFLPFKNYCAEVNIDYYENN